MAGFFGLFRKSSEEYDERRKFPRKKKTYIGEVEAKGKKTAITVNNLSQEGMGITLTEKLEIDSEIKVALLHEFKKGVFSGETVSMALPARVVWTRQLVSAGPEAGDQENDSKAEFDTGLEMRSLDPDLREKYDALLKKLEDEEKQEEKKEEVL